LRQAQVVVAAEVHEPAPVQFQAGAIAPGDGAPHAPARGPVALLAQRGDALARVGALHGGQAASAMDACTAPRPPSAGAPPTGIGTRPSRSNSASSFATSGLPVVSSFSPWKIELAPAAKHSACSSSLIVSRPADSRTKIGRA